MPDARGEGGLERLLTIPQVADILGIAPSTVRKRIQNRELESVKIGRAVRIRPQALRELIGDGVRPAGGSAAAGDDRSVEWDGPETRRVRPCQYQGYGPEDVRYSLVSCGV